MRSHNHLYSCIILFLGVASREEIGGSLATLVRRCGRKRRMSRCADSWVNSDRKNGPSSRPRLVMEKGENNADGRLPNSFLTMNTTTGRLSCEPARVLSAPRHELTDGAGSSRARLVCIFVFFHCHSLCTRRLPSRCLLFSHARVLTPRVQQALAKFSKRQFKRGCVERS